MLYSRSVELLDLIGIYPRIADIGFMVRCIPGFLICPALQPTMYAETLSRSKRERPCKHEVGPSCRRLSTATRSSISGVACNLVPGSGTLIRLSNSFSIRQKYLEDALREAIHEADTTALRAPAKLVDYSISSSPEIEYPVIATVQEGGETYQIRR